MSADTAPAAMPGEREIARALLDSGINIGTSTWPREQLQDATELARAILDLFAPILAEKERLRETLRLNSVWDFPRDIQNLTVKLEVAESRALAAEAALAAEREKLTQIADGLSQVGNPDNEWDSGYRTAARCIADHIRDRSKLAARLTTIREGTIDPAQGPPSLALVNARESARHWYNEAEIWRAAAIRAQGE